VRSVFEAAMPTLDSLSTDLGGKEYVFAKLSPRGVHQALLTTVYEDKGITPL
jgi:hypothetical protein